MSKKIKKIKSVAKKEGSCFVIMPFGGNYFDDYYLEIYCPAIEEAGFEPHRADDLFAPNNVVEDIWEYTKKSNIILADLTGKNPNVFYELGLAHAIAKPVILITESEQDIPFDLRAIRIIKYDKNLHDWGILLRNAIIQAIKEIIKNPEASIPSPFLKSSQISINKVISSGDKNLLSMKQDIELLKKQISLNDNLNSRSNGNKRVDIGPDKAKILIKDYVKSGMDISTIVERMTDLGPPKSWIIRQYNELKGLNNSTSELDKF